MLKKISYFKSKGKYLVAKEDGRSVLLNSEKEFNRYVEENKCEVIK